MIAAPSVARPALGFIPPIAAPVLAPVLPAIGSGGAALGAGILGGILLTREALRRGGQLWGYLNKRSPTRQLPVPDGDYVFERSAPCFIEWVHVQGAFKTYQCDSNLPFTSDPARQYPGSFAHVGRGWRVQQLGTFPRSWKCAPGADVPGSESVIESVGPDGSRGVIIGATLGGTAFRSAYGGPTSDSLSISTLIFDGVPLILPSEPVNPALVPPEVEPFPGRDPAPVVAPKLGPPEPMIEPLPKVAPQTGAPETQPEAQPAGDPVTPSRPTQAPPAVGPKPVVPIPGTRPGPGGDPIGDEFDEKGELLPKPKPPVPVTPPWQIDYGTGPIGEPAKRPRSTPKGIATELGKLEEKSARLLQNPGGGLNILDAIEAILTLLASMTDGAPAQEWRIREGCPVPLGAEPDDRFIQIPATSDNQASMLARFDGLALLIQAHKDLRGPVCRGARVAGVSVTVNFRSVDGAGANGRPLRKVFSYRDPSGGSLQSHTAAWRGFSFRSGAVVVSHDGSAMGSCKVWAVNAAEGMRVIRHAARECGLNADVDGEFSIVRPRGSRMGRAATMAPQDLGGGAIAVTVRDGSSGSPVVVAPGI